MIRYIKKPNNFPIIITFLVAFGLIFYNSPFTLTYWNILSFFIGINFFVIYKNFGRIKPFLYFKIFLPIVIFTIIFNIISFIFSPLFFAKDYATLISPKDTTFNNYFVNDYSKIRKVTEKMARVKADKIFGKNIDGIDLTTQYELDKGSIIKFKNKEYWLFPLRYSGFFQWKENRNVKGYILVDAINPNEKPIFKKYKYKYASGAFLFENPYYIMYLKNNLRELNIHPELNENGDLYWIAEVLKYKFIGNTFFVDKVFTLNARSGKINQYNLNNLPSWIDKAYPKDLIDEYIRYYGKYKNGFLNSLFTKKNIATPTLFQNREIYLIENTTNKNLNWYTGMTSINSNDNSLLYGISVDAKNLKSYKIKDLNGITDEKGAIDAINSKLGANSIRWKAVLPMPLIYKNAFFYHVSIIDKNSGLYQKSSLINGKNISHIEFINSSLSKNISKNLSKKDLLIKKVEKLEKELKELKDMLISF